MSSSALRDHYIQVGKQTNRQLGYHNSLIEVKITVTEGTLTAVHLVQGDCLTQSFNSRKASLCRKNTKKDL